MLCAQPFALALQHERVNAILYVVGKLSYIPGPDLVIIGKLVCRSPGDVLEGTLHALKLFLKEFDLPLQPLLQIVLAGDEVGKLGNEARQCPRHDLHVDLPLGTKEQVCCVFL